MQNKKEQEELKKLIDTIEGCEINVFSEIALILSKNFGNRKLSQISVSKIIILQHYLSLKPAIIVFHH